MTEPQVPQNDPVKAADVDTKRPGSKSLRVGDLVEVTDGSEVVHPDGRRSTVNGSQFALDVPGDFQVDGKTVTVG